MKAGRGLDIKQEYPGTNRQAVLQDKTRIVGESLTLWALSWPFLAC